MLRTLRLVAAVLVAAAPLAGAPASGRSADTFSGSCDFSGTVTFDPPLTSATQSTHAVARASGPCSGTFTTANGKAATLNDDEVLYRASSDGDQSCGSSTATGAGWIEYRHHKLYFTLAEERLGAIAPLQLEGRSGGSFSGTATASGDPATIAQQCAGGGLRQSGVDISGSTTPTISG